jgi:hypothetical protein
MLAGQIESSYPKLPGAPYLRCVAKTKLRAFAAAKHECEEALARQPDAVPPQSALAELKRIAPQR